MTQVAPLAGYQSRIYLEGLGGRLPELPLTYEELEKRAERQLTRGAYGYVAGGAGSEDPADHYPDQQHGRDADEVRRRHVP